jgi:hypothetical protein
MTEYFLTKSHNEWSSGTRVTLLTSRESMERIGNQNPLVRVRLTSLTKNKTKPELDIPLDKLGERKPRSGTAPAINSKERRRRIKLVMRKDKND